MLFLGQVGPGLIRLENELQTLAQLEIGLIGVKRALHLRDEFDDFMRQTRLRGGQILAGDPGLQRKQRDTEKILRDRVLRIRDAGRDVRKSQAGEKDRILQQPGLDQIGLGDAKILEGGLQVGIVEQRDLRGGIRIERRPEPLPGRIVDQMIDVDVLVPDHALPGEMPHLILHRGEGLLRAGRGAPGQEQGRGEPEGGMTQGHGARLYG